MKTKLMLLFRKTSVLLFIGILMLPGCLGGGGGGGDLASVGGGIGGTGVSMGSVSGFGSIIINGTRFDTSGASFTVNGASASQSDIQIGQIVRAETDFNASTTSQVDYAETVRGPIENINQAARTMTVLNQQVIVNDTTSFFNNLDFATLVNGNEVEVSGTRTSTGAIVASYIRLRNGTSEYRIIGQVANLTATTFEIVGPAPRLIINYSAANQMGLSAPLAIGQLIEARGMVVNFNAATETFVVDELRDGLDLDAAVDDQIEFEGIITSFTSQANFIVNGLMVDGSGASLVFEDGSAATPGDLGVNIEVEVEGSIQASGALQATRIVIQLDSLIRITATVDSVNAAGSTITLLGETFVVTASTRFEDDSAIALSPFGLANIMPGDYVEVRGSMIGANIVATRIEREDADTEVELQGFVEAFDAMTMTVTILGNVLTVDGATTYSDENDMSIGAAAFFAAISNGSVVKAQWDPFGALTDPVDEFDIEQL